VCVPCLLAAKLEAREAPDDDVLAHPGNRLVQQLLDGLARVANVRLIEQRHVAVARFLFRADPTRISAKEESADGDVPLLDQPYIRDASKTIQELLNETIARVRENIVIRRFSRFELGGQ